MEDSESTFRFDYPVEFIRWALSVPGYNKEWHVGVRVSKTKKLYGFIAGTPVKLNINKHTKGESHDIYFEAVRPFVCLTWKIHGANRKFNKHTHC